MLAITDATVTIATRNDAHITLPGAEFVRRFALHLLPKGFRKVRHYGLLAPSNRARLEQARDLAAHVVPQPAAPAEPKPVPEPPRDDVAPPGRGRCPNCAQPLRDLRIPRDLAFNPCARGPP